MMKDFYRIPLFNSCDDSVEWELAVQNEMVTDKDGYVDIAPYGDARNIHPEGFEVIQRFTKADADRIVSTFNKRKSDEEEAFAGVPIFKRHPKRDGIAAPDDDRTRMGKFAELQAGDKALRGKPLVTKKGNEFGMANRFPTAHWFCNVTGKEDGKLVLQPFELEHVGLTARPNLPVAPMFNEAVREKYGLPNESHAFQGNQHGQANAMDKTRHALNASDAADEKKPADKELHAKAKLAHEKAAEAHRADGNTRAAKWHDAKAGEHEKMIAHLSPTATQNTAADDYRANVGEAAPSLSEETQAACHASDHATAQEALVKTGVADAEHGVAIRANAIQSHSLASDKHIVAMKAHTAAGNTKAAAWHKAKSQEHSEKAKSLSTPSAAASNHNHQQKDDTMNPSIKTLLISLLAAVGVTLANDAKDEDVAAKAAESADKLLALPASVTALANAKTEHEKEKTEAAKKLTELQASLENSQGVSQSEKKRADDVTGKLATVEADLGKTKTDLTVANTVLDNERKERGKAADKVNELSGQIVKVETERNLAVTSLNNEVKAHADTKATLGKAKTAIINVLITTGRITSAQRARMETALANEVDFGKAVDDIAASKPVIKMVPVLDNVGRETINAGGAQQQYRKLVKEYRDQNKCSHEKATIAINNSEQGKALLNQLHTPEKGIAVAA